MPTSGELEVFGETYNDDNILSIRKRMGWISSSYFDKYYTHESILTIVLSGLTGGFGVDGSVTPEDVIHAKELLKEWHLERKHDFPF